MSGKQIDSIEAERIGLITRIVANGTTITEAVKLADEIAKFPSGL